MNIKEKKIGVLPGQKDIYRWDIQNKKGTVVSITNYGAIIMAVKTASKKGRIEDITVGHDRIENYVKENPFLGCFVGRFANRIGKSAFTIDKKTYRLPANDGKNQLHGGPVGLNKAVFASRVETTQNEITVILTYFSPDGDQGFPGNLFVQVFYSLNEKNEFKMQYKAVSDKKTPVNLTNHAYWNLASQPNLCPGEHMIRINADALLEVDKELIPTGEFKNLGGTLFDLRKPVSLKNVIENTGGVDHCYVPKGRGMRFICRVTDKTSGRGMDMYSDQPGVQLYTGNFLNNEKVRGNKTFSKHNAFCLETQNFPDAPNHANFPNSILEPGEEYTHTTIHKFFTV